jgi:hypothetical protein
MKRSTENGERRTVRWLVAGDWWLVAGNSIVKLFYCSLAVNCQLKAVSW